MRLATLDDGRRDGQLALVSADGGRAVAADGIASTMQDAVERWREVRAPLQALADDLERGASAGTIRLDVATLLAPVPRAWQWLDGSAFESHLHLVERAFGRAIPRGRPLMYQGLSNAFYAPRADAIFVDEAHGIDFEGEFGVVVDDVPMGVTPDQATDHIVLLVQINDWSLRAIAPIEMETGFGWVQAKPTCSMAPFAVTPDELGGAWTDGRVGLDLHVDWNGRPFGHANGREMSYGFPELIAHAAATRPLCAGTIIGSGTVANANYREVGSSCIAERRGIEIIDHGEARTPFMAFGDRVRMEARSASGVSVFGAIDQRVVEAHAVRSRRIDGARP